jgi:peptidoglycan/LPS O-acetylase OafA/YrhL
VLSINGSGLILQLLYYLVICAVLLAVGWLSWNLYEKHFLALKRFFPRPAAPPARPQPTPAPADCPPYRPLEAGVPR